MTFIEISTISIALLSLFISLLVIIRDRRQRQIDMLYKCYERLHQAHGQKPFASISNLIEMEDNPDDERWSEYKQKSDQVQHVVERELEFACYLVINKQINLRLFFYLFKGWLASREMFWRSNNNQYMAKNHPYTVKIIKLCIDKKILPIKNNREIKNLQNMVAKFLLK
jgi:hypothetical protein